MATYAYLVDPENQFMTKSGTINVSGFLKVFDAATDDIVVTYKDFNGTENQASIPLDNNGRAIVIADSERAYRLEVYDRYGTLLWTTSPLWCLAAGGGVNVHRTEVISTDGSIDIDKVTVGSTTTFDIGLAPANSDEFLEWVKCADEDVANGIVYPTYVDGTMETQPNQGLHVGKDRFYHITASFRVYPSGTGINYESLTTELKFNDGESTSLLIRRTYDIDNSLHDSVMCEFSYDFKAPADGYLFFQLDNVAVFHDVAVVMQVHRIYSGINAVPDTCATKQWVQETFDYNLSGKIGYSALEYDGYSQITGISGSAIATTDPSIVSAIASSYAESAVSGKVDQSAFDDCCSAMHSALDDKLDKSASSMFALSGDYAYNSSLSGYIPTSASGEFAPSGDYAFNSAVSSKLDASASGDFVLVSSYSSFSSEVTNNISSISSTVSGLTGQYIEQSASGMFAPSGNYVSASDMSAYVPFSGLEGDGSKITGISGSAIKGHEYAGIEPVWVDNTADQIGVHHKTLAVDETMTAYESGDSAVIGVNTASVLDGFATETYVDSGLSGKLDVTASSLFITSLPSDLATTADVASAVSGKMDDTERSAFYPSTSNPSGYLTAHQSLAGYATEQYVDSSVSSKLDSTAYDSAQFLLTSQSGIFQPSGYYQPSGEYLSATESSNYYPTSNPSGFISGVDLSPYQKTADMSGYYTTANESGFITGVDLTPYQTTAGMTAYQEVSGMTAYQPVGDYQPSGDYIQESALGWVEV